MHELAVTQSILKLALQHGVQENALRVTDIHITIGGMSGIIDDSVQFYWDIISEGTICKGARLHFTRKPTELICLDCGNEYHVVERIINCPNCNSRRVRLSKGHEFMLDSIEIQR